MSSSTAGDRPGRADGHSLGDHGRLAVFKTASRTAGPDLWSQRPAAAAMPATHGAGCVHPLSILMPAAGSGLVRKLPEDGAVLFEELPVVLCELLESGVDRLNSRERLLISRVIVLGELARDLV